MKCIKHWWMLHCKFNPYRVKTWQELLAYCTISGLYGPLSFMCMVLLNTNHPENMKARTMIYKRIIGNTQLHGHMYANYKGYAYCSLKQQYRLRKQFLLEITYDT